MPEDSLVFVFRQAAPQQNQSTRFLQTTDESIQVTPSELHTFETDPTLLKIQKDAERTLYPHVKKALLQKLHKLDKNYLSGGLDEFLS